MPEMSKPVSNRVGLFEATPQHIVKAFLLAQCTTKLLPALNIMVILKYRKLIMLPPTYKTV
jgi:hypothetical protein